MDDGGRCLLDVINDPQLLQSFLESDSEGIAKDHHHHHHHHSGGSMTVASSTVLIGCDHVTTSGQLTSSASLFTASGLKPSVESMGFNCQASDKQNLMGHITLSASNNSSLGVGVSVVSPVTSSIHLHTLSPTFVNSVRHHFPPNTPRTALSLVQTQTPVQFSSAKLSNQGCISVQSMPPPSPHQMTRSPLPPHTPSPVPVWSPSHNNAQLHNMVRAPTPTSVGISHAVTQVVHSSTSVINSAGGGNVIIPTSVAQKLHAQQVVYHHQHQQPTLVPLSIQHQTHQPTQIPQVVTTTSSVTSPVVQFISAPHQNTNVPQQNTTSARSGHNSNRSIQPKQPQQILPKPPNANTVKQVTSAPAPPPPRTATVGVGLNQAPGNHPQMMISQNAPSVFTGPQGTIVFNHVLPNMGQTPLLIQGNIGNLQGMQFTLRPQQQTASFTTGASNTGHHTLQHNGAQNNAALIAALQASSQQSQAILGGAKPGMHGQHTIMIPSGLAGQNLNLSASTVGGQVLHSAHPSQGIISRPNFILAPRVMGPHQGFHLHTIQTPQGPMTIALAPGQALSLPQVQSALHSGALGGGQLGQGQVSMQSAGQSFFPGISLQPQATHQAIHSQQVYNQQAVQQNLIAAPVVTFQKAQEQQILNIQHSPAPIRRTSTPISQPMISMAVQQPQAQQHLELEPCNEEHNVNNGSRPNSVISIPEPAKPAKPQGLNLAELLKEHGIMPESTPPPSPGTAQNSNSGEQLQPEPETTKTFMESVQQQIPVSVAMPMNHPTVMQLLQANDSSRPQLKLSMTQDGSIFLQPPIIPALNVPHHQSSLPQKVLADIQHTMPVPAKAPDPPAPKTSKSHAAILARLNSGPAIAVPSIKTTGNTVISENKGAMSITEPMKMVNANMTSASTVIPVTLQTVSSSSMPLFSPSVTTVSRQSIVSSAGFSVSSNAMPVNANAMLNSKATTTYNCFNHVILGLQPLCNPNSQNISLAVTNTTASNSATSCRSVTTFRNVCSTTAQMNSSATFTTNAATNTMVVKSTETPTFSGFTDYQQRSLVESTVQVQRPENQCNSQFQQTLQPVLPKPPVHMLQKISQQQVQISESHPSTSNSPSVPAVINLQVLNGNSVCSTLSRQTMFRHQLIADQDAAVKSFTRKPFTSREDAIRRLLSFHVYHTPKTTDDDFQKADEIFEILSQHLLERRQKIFDKYQTLLLKESMKEYPTSEVVFVEKLMVEDEASTLALDKRLASEGKAEPCVPPSETATTSVTKPGLNTESNDCDDNLFDRHLTDHKTLKAELKTLQLRLHRSLKRDRASSPSEEDLNVDQSSKRSGKLLKNPKIERRSPPTSENAMGLLESSLPAQHRLIAKLDTRLMRGDNHREFLRPIENPNAIQPNSCHLEEDLMSKIRKELNLSPIDHDDHEHNSVHEDFEIATAASGLADFELPVARTDLSSNPPSVLSFAGDSRVRNEVNYDFGVMDSSSEWTEAYAEQDKKLFLESDAAVESILNSEDDEGHTPELGLSDIEDLDDELVRAEEHSYRRGAKEAIVAAAEHSLSNSKLGRLSNSLLGNGDIVDGADGSVSSILHNDTPDLILNTQVQSAIKSILNFQTSSENRSYSAEGDHELVSQVLNFNRRITRETEDTSEQGPFSMENVSIDYDDYNDDEDDAEEEEEEEDEDDDDDDDDEEEEEDDEDEGEDRGCSSGAGANGSVGSAYADADVSNPESDAALDEAVRSILL